MPLRLFGLKKKGKETTPVHEPGTPGHTPQDQAPPAPSAAQEPVEFTEAPGAPAAASPPEQETVPAAVGAAKALRAVRANPPARKAAARPAKKGGKGRQLTKKQLAQRKYAGSMAGVRKRAKKASGGKGRIAKRSGATKLRRQLGLKPGKAAKPAAKKAKKGASKKR